MKLSLVQLAPLAATLAVATVCAVAHAATVSDEAPVESISQAITPQATSTSSFIGDFGSPAIVPGTNSFTCALGSVQLFAGPMPTSYLPADGRLLQIEENAALFTGLSTTFGGDGRTTFALPNLKAVTPNNLAYGVCVYGTFIGNR